MGYRNDSFQVKSSNSMITIADPQVTSIREASASSYREGIREHRGDYK